MVPYFEQPSWHLAGPLRIHAFGLLVALAVLLGSQLAIVRCRRKGLDGDLCADLVFYTLVLAFACAHLYSVLAYFPGELRSDPLLLLRFWENISSFGGIVGAVIGMAVFFRFRARSVDGRTRVAYLDAIAFAFPFAWTIGRLGCAVAHDHPGAVTSFPLAVSLESPAAQGYIAAVYREAGRLAELPLPSQLAGMGYHDLGWYEFLYTLLVIDPAFLLLDRSPRPAGYFAACFVVLYVPARFLSDFLRVGDVRYLGLTPGQYAGLLLFPAALYAFVRIARAPRPR